MKKKFKSEWVDFKPEEKVLIKLMELAIRKRDQAEGVVYFLGERLKAVQTLLYLLEKPKKQGKKK